MKFRFYTALIVLISMTFASCTEPSLSEKILKDKDSFFRGLELGDPAEKIIKEEGEPAKSDSGLIEYNYTEEVKDSRDNKYTIMYKVHPKHGLYEITLETDLQNDEDVKATFAALKEHFIAKIGKPGEEEENYVYWEYNTEQFQGINVALHDKSREWKYGRVFLRVFIWPTLED